MIDREINYWQMLLQRVVVVIKALASRGLPFRGSNEVFGSSSNGNYMMLLEVLAEFDPFLSEHIRKYGNPGKGHISYLSSTICDEFIELLGKQVTNYILEEAKCSQYFSLIIDSTPDISHVDQLSFVIRYVKQNGEPVERFMKFLPHIGHKALDMFNAVTETLKHYGLDIQKCRGQSYDNASNMSGIYSGLQARVLEITPLASYVPCAGHSLNLVGTHAVESCIEAVSLFTLVQELYNFFSSSTHRWAVLTKHKTTILTTKSLSTTRWSARHDALRALQEEWPAIIRALEALQNDTGQKSSTRAEARGLLSRLNRLETAIMAKLWGTILSRLHKVNKYVQNEDIDAMAVVQAFKSLISFFDELRNQFDMYENKALDVCENKVYEYDQRRRTIRKLKDGESQDGEVSFSGRDNFRVNTFLPIIDKIKQQLIMRMNSYEEFVGKFGVIIKLMDLTTEKLENEFPHYSFPTLELVQANKPDIVLLDHQQKTMFVIEFSAPAEVNIVSKEEEKRTKYQKLLGQLRRLWPDYAVSLLVMVIGSLGGMRNTLLSALRAILVCRAAAHILAARMQKAVILGSLRLLRAHDTQTQ
nr:unnamed protein product [Callosobruchus chinensis]